VKQIRKRLTYANVMSSIAVFLVLGGATAFAASKIGSNQLKANSVTTGKIKKEAVTTAKIKKAAVTGAKIKLSSLGTVPSATNANNANTVGGRSVTNVFVKIPKNSTVTVGTFGAFKIVATCNSIGDFEKFELDPQTTDSDIAAFGNGSTGPIFEREQGKEPNSIFLNGSGIEENERGITTFSASQSGGAVVTGTLAYDDTDTFNAESVCAIYGEVIS
jgi:hypothetical protein